MTDSTLENNIFYKYLKKNFVKALTKWREPDWRICIPTNEVLEGCCFSQQFAESHALHQSTDSGELRSVGCGNKFVYQLEENVLLCHQQGSGGPGDTAKIAVLSEYLVTMQSSVVHLLLVGAVLDPTAGEETALLSCLQSLSITDIEGAESFLRLFSCHYPVLDRLPGSVTLCPSASSLLDMQCDLHDVLLASWDALIRRHSAQWQTDALFQDMLYNALDFFVMASAHSVVWWSIRERCGSMDELVTLRLNHLRTACFTPCQLQLPELAVITTPAAVVELAALGTLETALGRLHCMHAAVELLQAHAKQTMAELHTYAGTECAQSSVSEEELLGLLTMAIIEAQCQHLVSNLYYTSHYVFSLPDNHVLRRCVMLVRTALQRIMQLDINEIIKTPTKPPLRKEMSLHDLMKISSAVEQRFDRPRTSPGAIGRASPAISSLDLQWQQLTHKIQRSTMESATIDQSSPALYSPRFNTSPNSPYYPLPCPFTEGLASPLVMDPSSGRVNTFMEFMTSLPSTIRASMRRKQTEQRAAVNGGGKTVSGGGKTADCGS